MAFTVHFADQTTPLSFDGEAEYNFLNSGVLQVRDGGRIRYYASGHWTAVHDGD